MTYIFPFFIIIVFYTVLKILAVNSTQVREILNLRAGSHLSTNYNSNDVKWGNNGNITYIYIFLFILYSVFLFINDDILILYSPSNEK